MSGAVLTRLLESDSCTPADVLVCDVCGQPIDDLQRAMMFWDTDNHGGPVTTLRLAHKGRCDDDELGLSAELWWFGSRKAALHHLARMMLHYMWTGEQARRVALIAWAIPLIGSAKDAAHADRDMELMP